MVMDNENLIVERDKIVREETILPPEREQYYHDKIANLENKNSNLEDENASLKEELDDIKQQLEYLKRMMFGRKTEKTNAVMSGETQLYLFDEAESEAEFSFNNIDKLITVPAHQRKSKRTHKETFENLKVEEVTHHVKDRICSHCGSEIQTIGKEFVRDELVYVPAKIYLRKHYTEVVKCVSCGKDESEDSNFTDVPNQNIQKAVVPDPVIKGSYCSPELLSHILYEKYIQAVPLYRQEKDYASAGAKINRASMCNWVIYAGKYYAQPVFNEMKKQLLAQNVIHADETVVQVLKEPERKAKTQSRMWVYCTGKTADKFMALFEYTPTRAGENAVKFLDNYSGYLVCDGYAGYNKLKDVKRCGCWAHTRRKFVEALPTDKELLSTSKAAKGVGYINHIYEIERNFEQLSPEDKHIVPPIKS